MLMRGNRNPSFSFSFFFFACFLCYCLLLWTDAVTAERDDGQVVPIKDVNLQNSTVQFTPKYLDGQFCERILISGISRLKVERYASAIRIKLNVSEAVSMRFYQKVEVCFHRNASLELCQCESQEWEKLGNGQWNTVMSPYEKRYLDVKVRDKLSSYFFLSIEEELQLWRLFCLGFGFILLLLAPIASGWAPLYYSSSMTLGILLVVLLILFQAMKLLPMGKKNILYLPLYGSVLGLCSYLVHYFSSLVSSVLESFGLSNETYNPVSVFLLLLIILCGAALGYLVVRKYILSPDGSVDAGIAQFVKWAMRVIALFFILQSSLDVLFALVASGICVWTSSTLNGWKMQHSNRLNKGSTNKKLSFRKVSQVSPNHRQAEFLSRSAGKQLQTIWGSPKTPNGYYSISRPGHASVPLKRRERADEDYYSTYHNIPRRKFTESEWEDFTHKATKEALTEWASTPEVAQWLADNAHRMRLDDEIYSDDNENSSSGSSEEVGDNCDGRGLFRWL